MYTSKQLEQMQNEVKNMVEGARQASGTYERYAIRFNHRHGEFIELSSAFDNYNDIISYQQISQLVKNLDTAYVILVYETNHVPYEGKKIWLDIYDFAGRRGKNSYGSEIVAFENGDGTLHFNSFASSGETPGILLESARNGMAEPIIHELVGSHLRSLIGSNGHYEELVDAGTARIAEVANLQFEAFDAAYRVKTGNRKFDMVKGDGFRKHLHNQLRENSKTKGLQPFAKGGPSRYSQFMMDIFNGVEEYGWKPYMNNLKQLGANPQANNMSIQQIADVILNIDSATHGKEKIMKLLKCEICNGVNLMKQEGMFVCQTCGVKYSIEEARKMLRGGEVQPEPEPEIALDFDSDEEVFDEPPVEGEPEKPKIIPSVSCRWGGKVGFGHWECGCLLFDEQITNCIGFTLEYRFIEVEDEYPPYGPQDVYILTTNGKWQKVGTVHALDNNMISSKISLDSLYSIAGITVVPVKYIPEAKVNYTNRYKAINFICK